MVALLDGNVLIALTATEHVHYRQVHRWLNLHDDLVATCPITQGTLLRFLLREGLRGTEALLKLRQIVELPKHVFWPDEIGYGTPMMSGVIGHRQVTDAYLVALASYFGGSLVTLDKGLTALHGHSVELIST
ncbi:MAG: PIN domain-containing protein [Acidimicrobiia bacterium]|nr:PIN domain-containing protein [Acidimicrobiia bacterium]MYC58092.1 PIN domain-containing protein [Acidimicrobiia bacterium]MYI30735.1 PIN domain-containing protein [Acidimicrobiia bacterium]